MSPISLTSERIREVFIEHLSSEKKVALRTSSGKS